MLKTSLLLWPHRYRYLSTSITKRGKPGCFGCLAIGSVAEARHFRFQVNKKEGKQVRPKQRANACKPCGIAIV